jgi:phage-related holin
MYSFILMAHSGWRYLVLLALIVVLVKYLVGWLTSGKWSNLDTTLNRVTPIIIDVQWLLGLIVWIVGSWWASSDRAGAWEHPLTLTVAVVVAHIFSARVRKAESDGAKFRTAFIGYAITTILIVLGVYLVVDGWNVFA